LKYRVGCADDKVTSCTAKDIYSVMDKYEVKDKIIEWIEDEEGNILCKRLKPSVVTAQDLKGWD